MFFVEWRARYVGQIITQVLIERPSMGVTAVRRVRGGRASAYENYAVRPRQMSPIAVKQLAAMCGGLRVPRCTSSTAGSARDRRTLTLPKS